MKLGEIPIVPVAAQAAESDVLAVKSRQEASERRAVAAAVQELKLADFHLPNHVMSITYDRELGRSFVQIVDRESGEVIQMIPGQDVIERARFYRELEHG